MDLRTFTAQFTNSEIAWDVDNNFYVKAGAKKNPKNLIGFDIDGTLTSKPKMFNRCKYSRDSHDNICGLVSHRTLPFIFEFAQKNKIHPDFVCSASFQFENVAKDKCLKLSTKWFQSKRKIYIGDTVSDMINASNAGFEYFHPDLIK